MENKDIRWIQRFNNYKKALEKLSEATDMDYEIMSDLEKEGLIQRFEYTYELAWLTMKNFYEAQGETGIQGSKDAIKLAFNRGLLEDGDTWFDMVDSRIDTTHTYDEETAQKVFEEITEKYLTLLVQLETRLEVERLK